MARAAHIEVRDLRVGYGDHIILRNVDFDVPEGSIFFIIGGSGSGKTTLLRALVGLHRPRSGRILYHGRSFFELAPAERERMLRRFGVLYQSSGLFTSMTLGENVALPLHEFTRLSNREIDEVVRLKLELVGLGGFESFYPSELSGGMQKRAGLARAMALDPEILFFDEPSGGLDPVAARRLDELVLELRGSLGATVVIVSHDLASIFAIADECIYLDSAERTITARGHPHELLEAPPSSSIAEFLTRGRAIERTEHV
jgi:phospholipid/cholesterol/gamma-HCH transport system ATP-binding protein